MWSSAEGDLSFTSALTYDFEVYSAAQDKWLEVSSVSNFESYQANRLKLRFREPGEKRPSWPIPSMEAPWPCRGSLAALLENYQTPEGIVIPEVLHPYMGPGNTIDLLISRLYESKISQESLSFCPPGCAILVHQSHRL